MAELINSGQIIQKPEIVLNPNFFVPPGVVDAREMNEEEFALEGTKGDQKSTTETVNDAIIDRTPVDLFLLPPTGIDIVSQSVRVLPGGQQVVDVVIEVANIPGATNFEVRISKAPS